MGCQQGHEQEEEGEEERVPIGWEGKRASFRNCNSFARQELKLRGGREKEGGREGKCLSPLRERKELEGLFRRKITVP